MSADTQAEVPSNATPETEVEPEELPEPLASCIRPLWLGFGFGLVAFFGFHDC